MRRKPIRRSRCKNCKKHLNVNDAFCSVCGQENHYVKRSLQEIWNDFVSNFLNFDQKVWNSIITIFRHPGKLSTAYISGKKARYVSPIRFYLFASLVFFFLITKGNKHDVIRLFEFSHNLFPIDQDIIGEMERFDSMRDRIYYLRDHKEVKRKYPDLYKKLAIHAPHVLDYDIEDTLGGNTALIQLTINSNYDSIDLTTNSPRFPSKYVVSIWKAKGLYKNEKKLEQYFDAYSKNSFEKYFLKKTAKKKLAYYFEENFAVKESATRFSRTINVYTINSLLILPFSACLLMLFFRLQRKYFYDHLILTIHLHSFMLIILSLYMIVYYILVWSDANRSDCSIIIEVVAFFSTLLYILVYFLLSIRVFYRITWRQTILRGISIWLIYLIFVAVSGSLGESYLFYN